MRILYVAKHGSGGNDDEGAVKYALEQLGHEVECVQEQYASIHGLSKFRADFALFHHWRDLMQMKTFQGPKVSWCFDLIDCKYAHRARHEERVNWALRLEGVCDLCFYTDGDWAEKSHDKAHWLTQGADEREVEEIIPANLFPPDVLFVGGLGYGRDVFVAEMKERYGNRFKHIMKGCYGPRLKWEVSNAKIVVCPPTPVTNRYWSNRVYNMLRMGALVLHPYSSGLDAEFGSTIRYYHSPIDLHGQIGKLLSYDQIHRDCLKSGPICARQLHTYRHRCAELVRIVKEKLGI